MTSERMLKYGVTETISNVIKICTTSTKRSPIKNACIQTNTEKKGSMKTLGKKHRKQKDFLLGCKWFEDNRNKQKI